MSFLDSFDLGFGPQLINLKCEPKQWDNFHRDDHVCEKFMFCVKFWDCGTPNKLALQEINTPSKHPSNLVVCHAFFVGFFARRICDDGWHFVDFHARVGCDHPHHKLAISNISRYTALDSTKNVGGWIVISQPILVTQGWRHQQLHHLFVVDFQFLNHIGGFIPRRCITIGVAKCMANMERKWGTHIFASFCR